jgi:hypothetical protein
MTRHFQSLHLHASKARYILILLLIHSLPSGAQTIQPYWPQWYGDRKPLIDLLSDGYEIKAAVHLNDADILYVQKGGSAYRCLSLTVGMMAHMPSNTLNCAPLQKPKLDR